MCLLAKSRGPLAKRPLFFAQVLPRASFSAFKDVCVCVCVCVCQCVCGWVWVHALVRVGVCRWAGDGKLYVASRAPRPARRGHDDSPFILSSHTSPKPVRATLV